MTDIYAHDSNAAPDADFVVGELGHLVVGNRGRLLDARRTPIVITRVVEEVGAFEVEIRGFEDVGARWELPFEDVGGFQFARTSELAPDRLVTGFARAIERFDRPLDIECDPDVRRATLDRLAMERRRITEIVARFPSDRDVASCVAKREGDPRLFALLDDVLRDRGLAELERQFSRTFVSNPRSGETVKGHAIVLAELGLCPYRGKIVRDPKVFAGAYGKDRRADHLLVRMAFSQELWARSGHSTLMLYRGAATDGPLPAPRPSSFVSVTLSKAVADAHFAGGPKTQVAVLWRQAVPIDRLVMSFLETRAMNEQFKEAEAVLIADPANRAF
jgi:hypothetical protein